MGKLIDSDELKARLKNLHLLATSGYGAEEVVGKILDEMPEGVVWCKDCARNADNGGLYPDGRTKCPIQESYALLLDGYCHLGERRDDG